MSGPCQLSSPVIMSPKTETNHFLLVPSALSAPLPTLITDSQTTRPRSGGATLACERTFFTVSDAVSASSTSDTTNPSSRLCRHCHNGSSTLITRRESGSASSPRRSSSPPSSPSSYPRGSRSALAASRPSSSEPRSSLLVRCLTALRRTPGSSSVAALCSEPEVL